MRKLVTLLALLTVAGCASARGEAAASAADERYVVVNNNLTVPSGVSVFAVTRDGVRDRIGNVRPFQRTRIRLRMPVTQLHRLVAQTESGQEITSPVVLFGTAESYDWDLQANTLNESP